MYGYFAGQNSIDESMERRKTRMENLGMTKLFGNIYNAKKVLVTGHTGFKGSWLVLWLANLKAKVTGFSLPPAYFPNHFELLQPEINAICGDITDYYNLSNI